MDNIITPQEQAPAVELTDEELVAEKQKIVDTINNPTPEEDDDDVALPSEGPKKFANVYDNVDDLKKGITNLKSTLPDYVINGMSDEALEQHYVELRKEFSSKPPADEEPTPVVEDPTPTPKDDEAKNIVADDALWADLETEFNTNGGISDAQYDALKAKGIPSTVVDKYIDGLKSESTLFTSNVYALAGGEQEFNDMKAWAEDTYSQEEMDMISSGSKAEILFKLKSVKSEYDQANTANPRVFGSSGSKGTGYGTQADYLLDVMSPEYRRNAKFKAKVQTKFANSKFSS